jgi:DNA-binding FadR family transcriptional regulator
MEPFKSVRQGRISEEVALQIKNAIFKQHYRVGEKLPSEKELCELFQASRGVIREAIRTLEILGFIELKQGAAGGAFVKELSSQSASSAVLDLFTAQKISAKEVLQVRSEIETAIVRSVVSGVSSNDIALLNQAYLKEMETPTSYSDQISRQLQIHYVLADICENRLYRLILTCLLDLTKEIFLEAKSQQDVIHDPEEHKAIIEAIAGGETESAQNAIRKHLESLDSAMDRLEKIYRKARGIS